MHAKAHTRGMSHTNMQSVALSCTFCSDKGSYIAELHLQPSKDLTPKENRTFSPFKLLPIYNIPLFSRVCSKYNCEAMEGAPLLAPTWC